MQHICIMNSSFSLILALFRFGYFSFVFYSSENGWAHYR